MGSDDKLFINPLRQTPERVEFYEDDAGEHRWRVFAANGESVAASSEGFYSQQGAINNAKLTAKLITRIFAANESN